MAVPTVKVEFAPGSTWQTEPASISWVDITAYALVVPGIEAQRGASSARGQVDVGHLKIALDNSDRRFDPTYTAGPYYGQLLPGVPIRVTCVLSTASAGDQILMETGDVLLLETGDLLLLETGSQTTAPVWYGSVAKWPQRGDHGNRFAWVPIEAWDGFDKLARAKIPRSVIAAELATDTLRAFWPLDEPSGSTMRDESGNARDGTYASGTTSNTGTISTPDGGSYPAISVDGDDYGLADVDDITTTDHVVAALIDLSGVSDLTNGESLTLAEFGDGSGRVANRIFQWGVEIVSVAAKTARIFVKGAATTWDDYGYSGSFDISEPRFIASRFSFAFAMEHYVDGVVSSSTSNPTAINGVVDGFRVLNTKANGGGFRGLSALMVWADFSDVTAARIAEWSDAILAPLDSQTTDQRIGYVLDQIDWPTNLRDLETGNTTLGPATFEPGDKALEYLRLITATEDGSLFCSREGNLRFLNRYWRYLDTFATSSQFTFSDQNTGRGYAEFRLDTDDELLVNVARFTRRGGTEQVVSNATSVATYGEAEKQRSDLLHRTDVETRSLAEWTVVTQGSVVPRVPSIRVPLHRYAAADQESVLGLELGYRVTVNRTPQGVGSAISLDFLVDGIRHEVNAKEWWTTFYVSPVPQDAVGLFIWDTGAWNDADAVWAY